jgi:tetratricopeptide (TPR) repeat protein
VEGILRLAGLGINIWHSFSYPDLEKEDEVLIVILGESTSAYTVVQWVSLLEERLQRRFSDKDIKIKNLARPSINSDYLLYSFTQLLDSTEPNIVVSMMGINDNLVSNRNLYAEYTTSEGNICSRIRTCELLYLLYKTHTRDEQVSVDEQKKRKDMMFETEVKKNSCLVQVDSQLRGINRTGTIDTYIKGLASTEEKVNTLNYLIDCFAKQNQTEVLSALYLMQGYIVWRTQYHKINGSLTAENFFRRAYELNPNEYTIVTRSLNYFEDRLSQLQDQQNSKENITLAMAEIQSIVDTFPNSTYLKNKMGWILYANENFNQAKRYFLDSYSLNNNTEALKGLAFTFEKMNQSSKSNYYFDLYDQKKTSTTHPTHLKKNYLTLLNLSKEHNFQLIAMQYPLRKIEDLKHLLNHDSSVIYVSNEFNFRNELSSKDYYDLFIDNFANDFGHTTREGDRLIAENVAQHIEEVIS